MEGQRTRNCSIINVARAKKLAKESGKKLSKDALDFLARHVNSVITQAAAQHNGGKEIDATLLATIIGFKKSDA